MLPDPSLTPRGAAGPAVCGPEPPALTRFGLPRWYHPGMATRIGSQAQRPNPALEPLTPLVGQWRTTGSHPLVPWGDVPRTHVLRVARERRLHPDALGDRRGGGPERRGGHRLGRRRRHVDDDVLR